VQYKQQTSDLVDADYNERISFRRFLIVTGITSA
jgi:hypothetical protein